VPVHNRDIAAIFEEIGDLLEIKSENPFRIRAYRNAARQLESMGVPVEGLVGKGEDLTELPGIGEDLAAKIEEIVTTGKCGALEQLHKELPPTLSELLRVPGLGPKRVKTLYSTLHVDTVKELVKAARGGQIRALPGFGEKTELAILQALETRSAAPERFKLAVATQYAESLAAYLERQRNVERVVVAGSYRRARDTVGDLDIVVMAKQGAPVMDAFVRYDEVAKVVSRGETRSTVILKCGLQVDLRVVPRESFGAAVYYFTGSKSHNIAVRRLAQARGLKINEYGVFRGKKTVAGATEESVFKSVGLPYIPPELRENNGEIEAAAKKRLPHLIEPGDLKGDLHAHTRATDGHDTLADMATSAHKLGLSYLAITEHSRHLTVAHGLDPKRLRAQMDAIDSLNAKLKGFTLLKGIEVDILDDGSLDLPDSVLKELDIVVAAVHSSFKLNRRKQTERVLRALDHPCVNILAHPSGRLINSREPYDVDMLRIIRAAKQNHVALELNAHPERLDLSDVHCRLAREEGARVAISSDAHSVHEFAFLRYGVGQARRGWLERGDVINTLSVTALRKWLRR